MHAVCKHIFGPRALASQRRFMRRYMRKPRNMSMKEYKARVAELDLKLAHFPKLANGAPADNQRLQEDELMDIYEFSIPTSWQRQMFLHGFDPIDMGVEAFFDYCERIELSESLTPNIGTMSKPGQNGGSTSGTMRSAKSSRDGVSNKRKSASFDHSRNTKFYCNLHGQNASHDAAECRSLNACAKKARASHQNCSHEQKIDDRRQKQAFEKKKNHDMRMMVDDRIKRALDERASGTKRTAESEDNEEQDLNNFNFDMWNVSDSENSSA